MHCEVCDTWRALQVLCCRRTQETHNKPLAALQCSFTHPWRRRVNLSLLPWGTSLHDSSCSSWSAILVKLLACWSRGQSASCPVPATSSFSLLMSDMPEENCFCDCVGTSWGSSDKLLAFSFFVSDLFAWLQRPREVVDIPAVFAVRCELATPPLLVEDDGCLLLVVVLSFDCEAFCLFPVRPVPGRSRGL